MFQDSRTNIRIYVFHAVATKLLGSSVSTESTQRLVAEMMTSLTEALSKKGIAALAPPNVALLLSSMRNIQPASPMELAFLTTSIDKLVFTMSRSRAQQFSCRQIAEMIFGMRRMSSDQPLAIQLIQALTNVVQVSGYKYSALDCAAMINGLQGMSSDVEEVRIFVDELTNVLRSCTEQFSAKDIAMLMYGLRGLSSRHTQVLSLVDAVADILERCSADLQSSDMAMAIGGMRHLSNLDAQSVSRLITILARMLRRSSGPLSAHEAAIAMEGLGVCSNQREDPVLNELLDAMARLLERCTENVSERQAVSLVQGLRCMTTKTTSPEVLQLVDQTARLLSSCSLDTPLTPKDCGRLILALRGLHIDEDIASAPVVRLIEQSCRLVLHTTDVFSPRDIANCMLGIESLSPQLPQTRKLLTSILHFFQSCTENPTSRECSEVMYGMRKLSRKWIETERLIIEAAVLLGRCEDVLCGADTGQLVFGLREMSDESTIVRELVSEVTRLLHTCVSPPTSLDCVMMVNGLRSLSSNQHESLRLVVEITRCLSMCQDKQIDAYEFMSLLHGLRFMNGRVEEVKHLIGIVNTFLVTCKDPIPYESISIVEHYIADKKRLHSKHCEVLNFIAILEVAISK